MKLRSWSDKSVLKAMDAVKGGKMGETELPWKTSKCNFSIRDRVLQKDESLYNRSWPLAVTTVYVEAPTELKGGGAGLYFSELVRTLKQTFISHACMHAHAITP